MPTNRPDAASGHQTCVSSHFLEPGWFGECMEVGCGWQSPTFATHELAFNAASDHGEVTRKEARDADA